MYTFTSKLFSISALIVSLCACANDYAYNESNPDSYKKHWENNKEIRDNRFLYQISEECKENKGNDCIKL